MLKYSTIVWIGVLNLWVLNLSVFLGMSNKFPQNNPIMSITETL